MTAPCDIWGKCEPHPDDENDAEAACMYCGGWRYKDSPRRGNWGTEPRAPHAPALAVPEVLALGKEVLRLKASLWAIGHAAGIETKEDLMQAALAAIAEVQE